MNVLSLFNGMSGLKMACDVAGIKVDKYYSSEIDKFANKASNLIHPDTIQLGSVTGWHDWDVDWSSIDLVTGGFPCQAWSMAGKQLGDKDERGMLFWTMLDIMKHAKEQNPDIKFLIENVKMKKEFEEYITHHTEQALGEVYKILINSALVSAQNRNRYYWTNFPVEQPEDRGIVLADIIECDYVDRDKAHCVDANYHKGGNLKSYFEKNRRQLAFKNCIARATVQANTETPIDDGFYDWIKATEEWGGTVEEYNKMVMSEKWKDERKKKYQVSIEQKARGFNKGGEKALDGKTPTLSSNSWEHNNHLKIRDKSKTVRASGHGSKDRHEWDSISDNYYRKLTPRECMRLQTIPGHIIDLLHGVDEKGKRLLSNTQLYKMTGNGWTIDVIAHILKDIL